MPTRLSHAVHLGSHAFAQGIQTVVAATKGKSAPSPVTLGPARRPPNQDSEARYHQAANWTAKCLSHNLGLLDRASLGPFHRDNGTNVTEGIRCVLDSAHHLKTLHSDRVAQLKKELSHPGLRGHEQSDLRRQLESAEKALVSSKTILADVEALAAYRRETHRLEASVMFGGVRPGREGEGAATKPIGTLDQDVAALIALNAKRIELLDKRLGEPNLAGSERAWLQNQKRRAEGEQSHWQSFGKNALPPLPPPPCEERGAAPALPDHRVAKGPETSTGGSRRPLDPSVLHRTGSAPTQQLLNREQRETLANNVARYERLIAEQTARAEKLRREGQSQKADALFGKIAGNQEALNRSRNLVARDDALRRLLSLGAVRQQSVAQAEPSRTGSANTSALGGSHTVRSWRPVQGPAARMPTTAT